MRDWFYSVVAVTPMAMLVASLFDVDDWQLWALLVAGFWWVRVIEYAATRGPQ
jgi:hypothetical protein